MKAVVANAIPTIERLDPGQALRSDAFALPSVDEPGVQKYLTRYDELSEADELSPSDKVEFEVLTKYFSTFDSLPGRDELDRRIQWEIHVELIKKIRQAQDE